MFSARIPLLSRSLSVRFHLEERNKNCFPLECLVSTVKLCIYFHTIPWCQNFPRKLTLPRRKQQHWLTCIMLRKPRLLWMAQTGFCICVPSINAIGYLLLHRNKSSLWCSSRSFILLEINMKVSGARFQSAAASFNTHTFFCKLRAIRTSFITGKDETVNTSTGSVKSAKTRRELILED